MIDRGIQEESVLSVQHWKKLQKWYKKNGRHTFPWRKNRTAWSIFVAENLLRRTRADSVAKIFPQIIQTFPDAVSVLSGKSKWLEMTHELGLPSRFDQFFEACKIICEKYNGNIPTNDKQLLSLPGIGHYSSDAIRCFSQNEKRFLVDTNTLRLSSRLLPDDHIEQENHKSPGARALVSKAFGPEDNMNANNNFALLDLAALVCKTSNPECSICPLSETCKYRKNVFQSIGVGPE